MARYTYQVTSGGVVVEHVYVTDDDAPEDSPADRALRGALGAARVDRGSETEPGAYADADGWTVWDWAPAGSGLVGVAVDADGTVRRW